MFNRSIPLLWVRNGPVTIIRGYVQALSWLCALDFREQPCWRQAGLREKWDAAVVLGGGGLTIFLARAAFLPRRRIIELL